MSTDRAELIALYRKLYIKGWNCSRDSKPNPGAYGCGAPDAFNHGYDDNECGQPKWSEMTAQGLLEES